MFSFSATLEDDKISEKTEEEQDQKEKIIITDKYIGDRNEKGERHGKGWAILSNGDQYQGEYRNGIRHGHGLYVFKNGARYLGQYKNGEKSGNGAFVYPDGSIYNGLWCKNAKHGFGIYFYTNGDIYKGNWHKGQRHGIGTYYFKNDVVFKGTWKNGIRFGPAEVCFKNSLYHGNWNDKYPVGDGMFTYGFKYMSNGYYKIIGSDMSNKENAEYESQEKVSSRNQKQNDVNFVGKSDEKEPIWILKDFSKYDLSKLPKHLLLSDLSDSEPCSISTTDNTAVDSEEIQINENILKCTPFSFSDSSTKVNTNLSLKSDSDERSIVNE